MGYPIARPSYSAMFGSISTCLLPPGRPRGLAGPAVGPRHFFSGGNRVSFSLHCSRCRLDGRPPFAIKQLRILGEGSEYLTGD